MYVPNDIDLSTAQHLELDLYRTGNLIHTNRASLATSNDRETIVIAGDERSTGYREARNSQARFKKITSFIQLSAKQIVVVDHDNHCLRMIDRYNRDMTSEFSGKCETRGSKDGTDGLFNRPVSVIKDKNNPSQLLVIDSWYNAVRTVKIKDGNIGTFFESELLDRVKYLTQSYSGDIFVTTYESIYRITYKEKAIKLISGSPGISGFLDSNLANSEFRYPLDLVFIGNDALMVADSSNSKIRLLDLHMDKVTTLDICSGCQRFSSPASLLITNSSLYIGDFSGIQGFKRKL